VPTSAKNPGACNVTCIIVTFLCCYISYLDYLA